MNLKTMQHISAPEAGDGQLPQKMIKIYFFAREFQFTNNFGKQFDISSFVKQKPFPNNYIVSKNVTNYAFSTLSQ